MNPTQQQQQQPLQQSSQTVEQQHQQKQQQQTSAGSTTTTPSYKQVSIRQNFSDEAENLINQLINNVFYTCYTCSSMAYYFDREEIGLFGMANFFRWCARESYQCCRLLMDYIVVRGGVVQFETIKKPEKTEWGTPIEALEYCLNLKKVINQQVLKVHSNASEQIDPHLSDFLETMILRPLVEFIRKVGVLLANVERAGPKLGEYQFNKDIELYLERIMRETKLSHFNLPITAVGAPVPFAPPTIGGGIDTGISSPVSPFGPTSYLPNVGFSTVAGSTPNFNLADVINLISNFGLQQQYGRTRVM
jgi:ferritin heavy chain